MAYTANSQANSVTILTEDNYVNIAEAAVKSLDKDKWGNVLLTTSKIRNLLSNLSEIYNYAVYETSPTELNSKLQYLKVQFVYEYGRERSVEDFIKKAGILDHLDRVNKENDLEKKKTSFILFEKYMEALVAYHKFYGGKDK
ncbi:MAG: type III-A CRISPR-associated protein Csm2 [Fusobacteriaceae bacterium]|jgi:CRISPR-associated protein Csm2|nr:type III-A CRISPR-associated protein Csm2 [Fusobacteriaceae bacterium]